MSPAPDRSQLDEFREELRSWIRSIYEQRDSMEAVKYQAAADRIFDRERWALIWLTAQLFLTIILVPWMGIWGVLAGLSVLYVGAVVSGIWTLIRVRRFDRRRSPRALARAAARAAAACPTLDSDARALLIRLMNLSRLRPTARSLQMLKSELRETMAVPGLSRWRFLQDLAGAVEMIEASVQRTESTRTTQAGAAGS
ncbi:MAG: hypothetical protein U0821_07460 [Chloroflexota bacterium]